MVVDILSGICSRAIFVIKVACLTVSKALFIAPFVGCSRVLSSAVFIQFYTVLLRLYSTYVDRVSVHHIAALGLLYTTDALD